VKFLTNFSSVAQFYCLYLRFLRLCSGSGGSFAQVVAQYQRVGAGCCWCRHMTYRPPATANSRWAAVDPRLAWDRNRDRTSDRTKRHNSRQHNYHAKTPSVPKPCHDIANGRPLVATDFHQQSQIDLLCPSMANQCYYHQTSQIEGFSDGGKGCG